MEHMDHIESLASTHRLTHDGTNPDCAFCTLFGDPRIMTALVRAMVREELADIQLERAQAEHDDMDIMEEIEERRRRRQTRAAELAEDERRRLEQRIDDLERKQWQR